jgi:hypothetical protein
VIATESCEHAKPGPANDVKLSEQSHRGIVRTPWRWSKGRRSCSCPRIPCSGDVIVTGGRSLTSPGKTRLARPPSSSSRSRRRILDTVDLGYSTSLKRRLLTSPRSPLRTWKGSTEDGSTRTQFNGLTSVPSPHKCRRCFLGRSTSGGARVQYRSRDRYGCSGDHFTRTDPLDSHRWSPVSTRCGPASYMACSSQTDQQGSTAHEFDAEGVQG